MKSDTIGPVDWAAMIKAAASVPNAVFVLLLLSVALAGYFLLKDSTHSFCKFTTGI